MIWCSGQMALFLLEKAAQASLPTALSMALRPLFPFQQAQYVQVFPLKPAPSCKLFAGLSSTKSATSLLLLSDLFCLLLHLSFYLNQSGRNCLLSPSVLSGYNGFPDTHFSRGRTRLIRRGALLAPSAIPCSLSPPIYRIQSSLFSDWRRTVLSKFFDTQAPSISTEELVIMK